MARALVQSRWVAPTASSPQAVAFTSNVTSGNRLFCTFAQNDYRYISSITDSQGNTWHRFYGTSDFITEPGIRTRDVNQALVSVWTTLAGSTGANTVTITFDGAPTTAGVIGLWEESGWSGAMYPHVQFPIARNAIAVAAGSIAYGSLVCSGEAMVIAAMVCTTPASTAYTGTIDDGFTIGLNGAAVSLAHKFASSADTHAPTMTFGATETANTIMFAVLAEAFPSRNLKIRLDASLQRHLSNALANVFEPSGTVASGGDANFWHSTTWRHTFQPDTSVTVFNPPDITWENDAVLTNPSVKAAAGSAELVATGTAGSAFQNDFISTGDFTFILSFLVESTADLPNNATVYFNAPLWGNPQNNYWGLFLKWTGAQLQLHIYNWDGNADSDHIVIAINTKYVVKVTHSGTSMVMTIWEPGGITTGTVTVTTGATTNNQIFQVNYSNAAGSFQVRARYGENLGYGAFLTGQEDTDATDYMKVKWLGGVNTGPTANAGPNQSISACPGTATLDASSSSDPDLDTLTFAWSLISQPLGASAAITSPTSDITGVTGLTIYGAYVFEVEVDDGNGHTDTDQVTITVANTVPLVNAGVDQVITWPVNSVNLSSTESDPDSCPDPLTGTWVKVSGPGTVTFGNTANAATTAQFSEPGSYVLRRIVDDGEDTAQDNLTVTVNEAPPEVELPTADVGIGLTWVEFLDKAGTMHVSSKIELPDPLFYYYGFKEPRVISWGQIVRALSDRQGQYESGEFSWIWSDTDRAVRALLAADSTKLFVNRPITVRMIDDVNRRLYITPRTMWKGLVRGYKPLSPLHFQVNVSDSLANRFSSENEKQQIPARLVTRADFTDCPTDKINLAVPAIYGDVTDAASSTAPPIPSGDPARGAYIDSAGNWSAGFGNLTSSAAVVTGLAVAAVAGGTLSADVPNGEYGVMITAVDNTGRESDPSPFYWDGPGEGRGSFAFAPGGITGVPVSGSDKITVSWSASAGAVAYRIYLGWYYYGFRPQQVIQTASLSCEFTTGPPQTEGATLSNITPGATLSDWAQFWYYQVSAVMPDGETGLSPIIYSMDRAYRRPIRIEWLTVPSATAYRIYRKGASGTHDRMWEVAAPATTFDDDLLDTGVVYIDGAPAATGLVPVIPVGTRLDVNGIPYFAFLICGHACSEITGVFQGGVPVDPGKFGATWFVPGKTDYGTRFPNTGTTQYLDINGNRYTMLFVIGPDGLAGADGTLPITLNVKGIEATGDSSGALITDVHQQYKHIVINWILQTYTSGAWLTAPTFEDDEDLSLVDEDSFDLASDVADARLAGGYPGAFIIGNKGERISRRDLIARLNVSGDVDSGFNRKAQWFVTMADDDPAVLAAAPQIQDVNDVLAGSFSVDERTREQFNVIPFVYDRDYIGKRPSGWNKESSDRDDVSIDPETGIGEEKPSPKVELHMIRNTAVAEDIISRRLARTAETPRVVTWQMGMAGLSYELGDVIRMTHFEGIDTDGWTDRPLRIIRHMVDPNLFQVTLEALDVDRLFA